MADQYNKILTTVNSVTSNYSFTPDLENVIVIDTSNNRIGVKTSDPLYEIDVSGTIKCNNLIISDSIFSDYLNNKLKLLTLGGDISINIIIDPPQSNSKHAFWEIPFGNVDFIPLNDNCFNTIDNSLIEQGVQQIIDLSVSQSSNSTNSTNLTLYSGNRFYLQSFVDQSNVTLDISYDTLTHAPSYQNYSDFCGNNFKNDYFRILNNDWNFDISENKKYKSINLTFIPRWHGIININHNSVSSETERIDYKFYKTLLDMSNDSNMLI